MKWSIIYMLSQWLGVICYINNSALENVGLWCGVSSSMDGYTMFLYQAPFGLLSMGLPPQVESAIYVVGDSIACYLSFSGCDLSLSSVPTRQWVLLPLDNNDLPQRLLVIGGGMSLHLILKNSTLPLCASDTIDLFEVHYPEYKTTYSSNMDMKNLYIMDIWS